MADATLSSRPAGIARLLTPGPGPGLTAHLERFGPLPGRVDLIRETGRSGLRGRGGAAFPTATKLAAVAGRRRPVIVANGVESEPLSAKDKTLLVSAPHLVLDGIVLAARAIGGEEAIVGVDRSATRVIGAVETAIAQRRDPVEIRVATVPSRFVAGEETALIHWLNGGDARPTTAPPRPSDRGVGGRPTLVQNVETLAQLALIGRWGSAWYRSVGTSAEPGTTLTTVGGAVGHPGVYEVAQGSSVLSTLHAAGLGVAYLPTLLVGGYFGSWADATAVSGLEHGSGLGCGVVWVLPAGVCGLAESARVARWFAEESAGQCGPCSNGLPAIAAALEAVAAGHRSADALAYLQRWCGLVVGRGACRHPDGAARFVSSAIRVFAVEIEQHARRGPCAASAVRALPIPEGGAWR